MNAIKYPTIYALAMDILPIQASAVPCEHVFSSSKKTTTARHNRISPKLMEALQMLKYSVKKGHGLDFTADTKAEEEEEMLESMMVASSRYPEDSSSFAESLHFSA